MSITQEQIIKITKNLAKLPKSGDKIEHDLNSIIGYIDVLNELDTTGITPTVSVTQNKPFSSFKNKKIINTSNPNELLKCSGNKIIAGQIAIGNIMK
ncbi:MAG: aspartyl/glutamyl-tRNA amidotransferase subunit C [Candidatus Gracilibacteria bacterium]|nr:aspartyl/glutamyl-tRNA amidotransferase subunit C [Candidatus Gracilibacteria bacterium]